MSKFLNNEGLLYLWGKIKTYVTGALPKKVSELENDSKFITLSDVPEGAAASNTVPKANGTASAGKEAAFARGDHVHPHDDTKVDKVNGKGLSTNDFTNDDKNKLDGIAAGANNYTLPTAGSALGGVKTTSDVSEAKGYTPVPIIGGVPYYKDTDTTYENMGAATASAAGKSGLVPAPAAGAQAKYLRGDGTWGTPTNTTYKDATQSTAGLLSTADKKKLDAFGEASTYATKEDVTKQIADAGHIKKQIVESLPAASAAADNVIYMVAKKTANGDNAYDEYMLVSGKLEHIGDTQADIETLTTDDIDALIAQAQ